MIFLVKIDVTCVAILFKAYFLNTYLENVDLCLVEKYTLTSWLRERGGQDLDAGSRFRMEFSICE